MFLNPRGWRLRHRGLALSVVTGVLVSGLLAGATPIRAAVAAQRAPVVSAISTPSGSWVVLPMGILSEPSNTFWQVLHSTPGSLRWSLATPPGVADNGGLVAGASEGSLAVGVLPSGLLHFSPLARSSDGGDSWTPVYFPGSLSPLPDALAYRAAAPGGAIALTDGDRVLAASPALSSWSQLVSITGLRKVSRACTVTALDAVAILPTGGPLIGTGCRRGGEVGVFTRTPTGTWQTSGVRLGTSLRAGATDVLRLQVTGATTTALVTAGGPTQRALVALWRTGDAPWDPTSPLALKPGESVLSSSVGVDGMLAVLLGTPGGTRVAFDITSGGTWSRLPPLPPRTLALATPVTRSMAGSTVDAFTVDGELLEVFALTPSGAKWVRVQSSRVSLAYGSSS